jgi:tetratricopeptide (TPR) repeat protein
MGMEGETEARLLARAISELRRARDPREALATLERYGQLFPHGVLASESARTRLEALLQLHDFQTALSLLDDKAAFVGPLDADLLLTRAELRASAGRCRDAVADFTRGLEDQKHRPADGASERALYGRAVCLGRLGQDDRARADLTNYLGHFPSGRFALEAKRLLEGRNVPGHP